jgi:LysM repeat protein
MGSSSMNRRLIRCALLLGCAVVVASCIDNSTSPVAPPVSSIQSGRAAFYVVVERGQTLDHIAQIYRVPKSAIIAANHLSTPLVVKPGIMLEVPVHLAKPIAKAKSWTKTTVVSRATPKRVRIAKNNGRARVAKIKRELAGTRPQSPVRTETANTRPGAKSPLGSAPLSTATPRA